MGRGAGNPWIILYLIITGFLISYAVGHALAAPDPCDALIYIFVIALFIIIVLAAMNPTPQKDSTRTITVEARCPYCDHSLYKMPRRKTKCPFCGQYIYVRTKQQLFQRVLFTEEEATYIDQNRTRRFR